LGSSFNVLGSLTDRPPAYDLASAITATGIALFTFLLAAQPLPKAAPSSFIGVKMAVNRFMANAYLIGDLLWTPLFMKASHHFV
jgi:hypothetical protein